MLLQDVYDDGKLNAVRNPDGIWINTSVFREAGDYFMKYGVYTHEPWGSPAWYDFWKEERRRCTEGYSVGGVMIPGEFYNYMNYCPIQKSEKGAFNTATKIKGFPDFWDGDYNYFWVREIARNGVLKNNQNLSQEEKERIYNLEPKLREIELIKILDGLHLMFKIVPSIEKDGVRVENLLGGRDVIVLKSRRKGFEQPNSEVVMTPTGPTTMGELKVGSEVLTPKGKSKVIEYYPQGLKDVYEITLFDGRKVKCGLDHLWEVIENSGKTTKIVNTEYLLNKNLKPKKAYTTFLKLNNTVDYSEKTLPIPAYTLGAILGDGNVTKQFKLSGIDEEIFNNVLEEIEFYYPGGKYKTGSKYKANKQFVFDCSIEVRKDYQNTYSSSKYANKVNPVYEELKKLNLNVSSKYKYIPDEYKYSSKEQRLDLVKGLMDTDGTISMDGAMSFGNVSYQLVKDLQEVLQSLGINSTLRQRKDKIYIIYINTNQDIFSIKRKSERVIPGRKSRNKVAIVRVEKLGYQESSSCILIDDPEHLYLTRDYIVTHNSFKNASVGSNNFFHRPTSYTMQMAYDKKFLYPKGIFSMSMSYINFINDKTAWKAPSDYVRKQDHIRNSYKSYQNGVEIELGFMSEIQAITFKDNPQAGVGKDCYDIIGEEVGAWGTPGGLKETVASMMPSVTDGDYRTGMMTLFGTANDIEKGTVDFADMFENPESYTFLPFYDIWGANDQKKEGFFFPVQLNLIGHYDAQGNSNLKSAQESEELSRKKLEIGGATSTQLLQRKREFPLNSAEALTSIAQNNFPIEELKAQLEKVKANGWQHSRATPVKLRYEGNEVIATPILDKSVEPIISYKNLPLNQQGCVMIYEQPVANAPRGLYKIGYDPIDQENGTSLAGITVYKGTRFGDVTKNILVAEYIGRFDDPDDIDRTALMLADYYNTQVMHENMVTGVKNFFRRIKRLDALALQPDAVISKNVKNSKVARIYGCHMSEQLKDAGERYVKIWLLEITDYDENGSPIRVIDRIYSIRLLEELINYSRKANTDLVSSLFMCLFQVEEEVLGKVYGEKEMKPKYQQLVNMMENMYKKN